MIIYGFGDVTKSESFGAGMMDVTWRSERKETRG
jgi:hypothetical protein